LSECIGKGQFGSVYKALNNTTGQMVAIKRVSLDGMNEKDAKNVMGEVELLERLDHPSIVKYMGMNKSNDYLDIILE
jgi:serine/threonine protein kinase